jgi:hypothetical protein
MEPDVWSARADFDAEAADVLQALTDPDTIAEWAPVSFEIDGGSGRALRAGSCERISGSIAGLRVAFDVEVARADLSRLELVARGPLSMDVAYAFLEREDHVTVEAHVAVHRGGGLTGHVLARAVSALLNAGALQRALGRLEGSLCGDFEPELLAA